MASVALGGGVAANRALRSTLDERLRAEGLALLVPPPAWCTDNGAMIGAAAGFRYAAGDRADATLEAIPNLALPWLAARWATRWRPIASCRPPRGSCGG